MLNLSCMACSPSCHFLFLYCLSHCLITDSQVVFQVNFYLSFYIGFVHLLGVNIFHLTITVSLMLRSFILQEHNFQSNCNTLENVLQAKFSNLHSQLNCFFFVCFFCFVFVGPPSCLFVFVCLLFEVINSSHVAADHKCQ